MYLKCWKEKTCIQEHYPAQLSFRFYEGNKSCTDKQKLKRIQHHQTSFITNAKGTSLSGKGKSTARKLQENYKWESSPVKANIQLRQEIIYTQIWHKTNIHEKRVQMHDIGMHLKFRDQQLKTIYNYIYIYIDFYIKASWQLITKNLQ